MEEVRKGGEMKYTIIIGYTDNNEETIKAEDYSIGNGYLSATESKKIIHYIPFDNIYKYKILKGE